MRAAEKDRLHQGPQPLRGRSLALLPSALVGLIVLAIAGGAIVYFGAKHQDEHAVGVRIQKANRFAGAIGATVAHDVDAILKRSGMCGVGCVKHDSATWNWNWQITMGNGALLVDLTAWQAWQDSPDRYNLTVYTLSALPNGDLSVAHRLEPVLKELLNRFGYPEADQPFTPRNMASGNSRYTTRGPGPVQVLWPPFPGKERMRGQWSFTLQRKGPFTSEPDSWRAESVANP